MKNNALIDKTFLLTSTPQAASMAQDQLAKLGAKSIHIPLLDVLPPVEKERFVEGVTHAHTYDWILFSSVNAAHRFFEAFYALYIDARSLGGARIAALGMQTSKLIESYRFAVDVMPIAPQCGARGLIGALKERITLDNLTMLLVCGEQAPATLEKGLVAEHAIVDMCKAYTTQPSGDFLQKAASYLENPSSLDGIFFASGLAVESFFSQGLTPHVPVYAFGESSVKALKRLGYEDFIGLPPFSSMEEEALIEALAFH